MPGARNQEGKLLLPAPQTGDLNVKRRQKLCHAAAVHAPGLVSGGRGTGEMFPASFTEQGLPSLSNRLRTLPPVPSTPRGLQALASICFWGRCSPVPVWHFRALYLHLFKVLKWGKHIQRPECKLQEQGPGCESCT